MSDQNRYNMSANKRLSFWLALFMHFILFIVLFIGLHWQNKPVVPVEIEIWTGVPASRASQEVALPTQSEVELEPVSISESKERIEETVIEKKELKPAPEIVEKKHEPEKKPALKVEKEIKKINPKTTPKSIAKPDRKVKVNPLDIANIVEKSATPTHSSQMSEASNSQKGGEKGSALEIYLQQVKQTIKMNTIYSTAEGNNPGAVLKVFVLPNGTIREVQVVSMTGDPAFAQARRQALLMMQKMPPLPPGLRFSEMREWTIRTRLKE